MSADVIDIPRLAKVLYRLGFVPWGTEYSARLVAEAIAKEYLLDAEREVLSLPEPPPPDMELMDTNW